MRHSFANGSADQQNLVEQAISQCYYDFDQVDVSVTFEFVDTVPQNHTDVGYTQSYTDGTARISLVNDLADKPGGVPFALETVIHELGHVVNFTMPIGQDQRLTSYFGAPWSAWSNSDTGNDWRNAVKESVAETFKDIFTRPDMRAYTNRTARILPKQHFLDFVDEFCTPASRAPIAGRLGAAGSRSAPFQDYGTTTLSPGHYRIDVRCTIDPFVEHGILQVAGLLSSDTPFVVYFDTPTGQLPAQHYGGTEAWDGAFHAECVVTQAGDYTMHLLAPQAGGSFAGGEPSLVSNLSQITATYSWGGNFGGSSGVLRSGLWPPPVFSDTVIEPDVWSKPAYGFWPGGWTFPYWQWQAASAKIPSDIPGPSVGDLTQLEFVHPQIAVDVSGSPDQLVNGASYAYFIEAPAGHAPPAALPEFFDSSTPAPSHPFDPGADPGVCYYLEQQGFSPPSGRWINAQNAIGWTWVHDPSKDRYIYLHVFRELEGLVSSGGGPDGTGGPVNITDHMSVRVTADPQLSAVGAPSGTPPGGQSWLPDWPYGSPGAFRLESAGMALREIMRATAPGLSLERAAMAAQLSLRAAAFAGDKRAVLGAQLAMRQIQSPEFVPPAPDSGGGLGS